MTIFGALRGRIRNFLTDDAVNTWWHLPIARGAAAAYGFPGKQITLIGVTGTDGKTTTVNLIYHILKQARLPVSMISSVKAVIGDHEYETGFHVTSPHPVALQKFLRQAIDAGSQYFVLEVTSHGLAQHRLAGCDFAIGVLTNVTHEHLDYHKTYEGYLQTKFKLLENSARIVINRDDHSYRFIPPRWKSKTTTYGLRRADVTPRTVAVHSNLIGQFNQYNTLASIATARLLSIDTKTIQKAIRSFSGVPGRAEVVYDADICVIVDFAHTPHSFEQILSTLAPVTRGRIIHVFGCAALRDRQKRPLMGKISARFADEIVLTEEDYRTEPIEQIMDEIEQGVKDATPVHRIPNRADAIAYAIHNAKKADTVLITGKAHEKSLARGTTEYPWDEFAAIQTALEGHNATKR